MPSTDLMLSRVQSMLESNDPQARALALHAFAAMSVLIAGRLDVQHKILESLSSPHRHEVDAATFAIESVCRLSPVFAKGIMDKVVATVLLLQTTPAHKRALVRLMRHMHYDLETAREVRGLGGAFIGAAP